MPWVWRANLDVKRESHPTNDAHQATRQPGVASRTPARAPCPFLGIIEDPATAFAYATPANRCFCTPPTPKATSSTVDLAHQERYCLSNKYPRCPLYQGAQHGLREDDGQAQHKSFWQLPTLGRPGFRTRRLLLVCLFILIAIAIFYLNRDAITSSSAAILNSIGNEPASLLQPAGSGSDPTPLPAFAIGDETDTPSPTSPLPTSTLATPPRSMRAISTHEPTAAATATPRPTQPAATMASPSPTATDTPTPTATASATVEAPSCGPPPGWVIYVVQRGDTLFRLSLRYNVSMAQLMQANCLSSVSIFAGQTLFVPFHAPVNTPPPQPTATATETVAPTDEPPPPPPPATQTPAPPTATQPPPTATPPLPTATQPPPTVTQAPPTATIPPPTPTPPPPTPTDEIVPPTPTLETSGPVPSP